MNKYTWILDNGLLKKHSFEDFLKSKNKCQSKIDRIVGNNDYWLFKYHGMQHMACIICPNNNKLIIKPTSFFAIIHLKNKIKHEYNDEFSIIGVSKRFQYTTGYIKLKHKECNRSFWIRPYSFHGKCHYCGHKRAVEEQAHSTKWLFNKIKCLTNNTYKLLSPYKNSMTKVFIECPNKHIFSTTPTSFVYRGTRCPICCHLGKSKGERKVEKYLERGGLIEI